MSGTTMVGTATGAGAAFGTAVRRLAAPTARVALAGSRTRPTTARRGKRVAIRRAMLCRSAVRRMDSSPTESEAERAVPRTRDCRADDGEDSCGRRSRVGQLERRGRVLPAEGAAREALEPGLILRELGRRLKLEMEVRAGGVAGRADQADLGSGREGDTVLDGRLE